MKTLIIGGAGFVGAQLAFYLHEQGEQVIVADNLVRRGCELNLAEFHRRGIPFCHVDVRNWEDFIGLPRNIDVICLTAAQPSVVQGYGNPVFDINCNTIGAIHALESARLRKCGLIFWSTNKVYSGDVVNQFERMETDTRWVWDRQQILHNGGIQIPGFDPEFGFSESLSIDGGQHSIYGVSKAMADLACQEYHNAFGVPTVVNRFGCLAGPGQFGKTEQGWVAWFAIALRFGFPLQFIGWGGKQVRDVLFIGDVCRLVELEIKNMNRIGGQVFNIGGGGENTISLIEAANLLEDMYERRATITMEESPRKADQCIYISDTRKAQQMLGWQPLIGIREGYRQIAAWIEDNLRLLEPLYNL